MENEELISHEVAIDGEMFDFVMAAIAQEYPDKTLADVAVNFHVWSKVIANDIGLIIEEESENVES